MSEYCYKKEGGMFYLCNGDHILDSMEEVAIAYEENMETGAMLHKHGSKERVEKWMVKFVQTLKEDGGILAEVADNIKMISSSKWDLEDLNRCINNTGYIKVMLRKIESWK